MSYVFGFENYKMVDSIKRSKLQLIMSRALYLTFTGLWTPLCLIRSHMNDMINEQTKLASKNYKRQTLADPLIRDDGVCLH